MPSTRTGAEFKIRDRISERDTQDNATHGVAIDLPNVEEALLPHRHESTHGDCTEDLHVNPAAKIEVYTTRKIINPDTGCFLYWQYRKPNPSVDGGYEWVLLTKSTMLPADTYLDIELHRGLATDLDSILEDFEDYFKKLSKALPGLNFIQYDSTPHKQAQALVKNLTERRLKRQYCIKQITLLYRKIALTGPDFNTNIYLNNLKSISKKIARRLDQVDTLIEKRINQLHTELQNIIHASFELMSHLGSSDEKIKELEKLKLRAHAVRNNHFDRTKDKIEVSRLIEPSLERQIRIIIAFVLKNNSYSRRVTNLLKRWLWDVPLYLIASLRGITNTLSDDIETNTQILKDLHAEEDRMIDQIDQLRNVQKRFKEDMGQFKKLKKSSRLALQHFEHIKSKPTVLIDTPSGPVAKLIGQPMVPILHHPQSTVFGPPLPPYFPRISTTSTSVKQINPKEFFFNFLADNPQPAVFQETINNLELFLTVFLAMPWLNQPIDYSDLRGFTALNIAGEANVYTQEVNKEFKAISKERDNMASQAKLRELYAQAYSKTTKRLTRWTIILTGLNFINQTIDLAFSINNHAHENSHAKPGDLTWRTQARKITGHIGNFLGLGLMVSGLAVSLRTLSMVAQTKIDKRESEKIQDQVEKLNSKLKDVFIGLALELKQTRRNFQLLIDYLLAHNPLYEDGEQLLARLIPTNYQANPIQYLLDLDKFIHSRYFILRALHGDMPIPGIKQAGLYNHVFRQYESVFAKQVLLIDFDRPRLLPDGRLVMFHPNVAKAARLFKRDHVSWLLFERLCFLVTQTDNLQAIEIPGLIQGDPLFIAAARECRCEELVEPETNLSVLMYRLITCMHHSLGLMDYLVNINPIIDDAGKTITLTPEGTLLSKPFDYFIETDTSKKVTVIKRRTLPNKDDCPEIWPLPYRPFILDDEHENLCELNPDGTIKNIFIPEYIFKFTNGRLITIYYHSSETTEPILIWHYQNITIAKDTKHKDIIILHSTGFVEEILLPSYRFTCNPSGKLTCIIQVATGAMPRDRIIWSLPNGLSKAKPLPKIPVKIIPRKGKPRKPLLTWPEIPTPQVFVHCQPTQTTEHLQQWVPEPCLPPDTDAVDFPLAIPTYHGASAAGAIQPRVISPFGLAQQQATHLPPIQHHITPPVVDSSVPIRDRQFRLYPQVSVNGHRAYSAPAPIDRRQERSRTMTYL